MALILGLGWQGPLQRLNNLNICSLSSLGCCKPCTHRRQSGHSHSGQFACRLEARSEECTTLSWSLNKIIYVISLTPGCFQGKNLLSNAGGMGSILVLGRFHMSRRISWWTTDSELVWQNYSHPFAHGPCFTTKETTTLRNRAPHNYRVALTRLQQTEVHTAQKTHYRPKTKTSPSSLWALQLHWGVLYIHVTNNRAVS